MASERLPSPENGSDIRRKRRSEMGLISWILVGLVAGIIAKFLMPGRDPGGCIITILLGILGANLGGFLATYFGFGGISGFNLDTLLVAVVGSMLILILYRLLLGVLKKG
jgi:uncharacterized membrane protein YeaQ/YmgE (transglycosylase-associated protein family)